MLFGKVLGLARPIVALVYRYEKIRKRSLYIPLSERGNLWELSWPGPRDIQVRTLGSPARSPQSDKTGPDQPHDMKKETK